MKNIKAVIFDLDGTLIDRRKQFVQYCNLFIDKYSQEFPYEGTRENLIHYMVEIDKDGYGGLANFLPKLQKLWALPLKTEEFIRERNEVFSTLTTPFPEMKEVLDYLKERYVLGVITNGYSHVQRDKMKRVGITEYFQDIIVSGEEPYAKPDPRIFLLSCEHLKVRPEEAVYVGDYYPNDIAGAMEANIMPIWISDNPDEHIEYSGIRVGRLKEILKFL